VSITERAIEFCRFAPDALVADIGCGACGTLGHLLRSHGIKGFGVDPSLLLLAAGLHDTPEIPVVRGLAEALPFRKGVLDGLFCECVFSLVSDGDAAMTEFRRVLREGGFLVMSDLYSRTSWQGDEPDGPSGQRCSQGNLIPAEIGQPLEKQGFEIVLWEDRTDALKELAVRLIFAGRSLGDFWGNECQRKARDIPAPAMGSRPGYYLVVARKTAS
jgi:SAM-dependent methyltransferase